jgi:hypothetical protein
VRVVLAYETSVMLGGEVEALAFEIAWLVPVGTWTAQSPDNAVVRCVDGVKCADMASRYQVVASACRFRNRVEMAVER